MIVFRQNYPRWWFDWNLELLRFTNRVGVYLALMTTTTPRPTNSSRYIWTPPTPTPRSGSTDGRRLVKWFLAIPHYIVLAFLYLGVLFVVIGAWFAIVFAGRYPRALRLRRGRHPLAQPRRRYAFVLITDQYPTFQLRTQAERPMGSS